MNRIVFLVAFLLILGVVGKVHGAVVATATDESGATVSLTDEKCAVAAVSNLPARATWTEKGKVFEGCFGIKHGIVVLYFEGDRTVVLLHGQQFVRVLQL